MNENLSPAVTLTREQKEQRRLAAAQDLLEGEMSQVEIAEEPGVTPSAVSEWKSTLEEEGMEKFEDEDGNPRECGLSKRHGTFESDKPPVLTLVRRIVPK
jgi:transposase